MTCIVEMSVQCVAYDVHECVGISGLNCQHFIQFIFIRSPHKNAKHHMDLCRTGAYKTTAGLHKKIFIRNLNHIKHSNPIISREN